ncbi:hypothetical protein BC832DRAFT_223764 [Gaertneriomyces semiglobifer]|nr:hypothetical protein BC832DRAFT_223764 [Gaertneriomyces semiglobifer]
MRMNAYDAARYIVLYGGPLVDMAVADWRGDSLANNHVRFFLDNTIVFGPLFEESADRGGKAWANATTEKMHVLYALLAVLVVLLLSWGLLLFRPMLRNTTEEQVRALRMFAMIPKKSLMRILTDLEETIETMSDEISETDADKTANTRSNGRRARHVMSPSFGKEAYLNRSPTRRHKLRYLGGLLLVALPAIALVSAPIVQTSTSIAFAETMTFTNSRRYLAQAVRMLGVETFFHDPTTWGPGQEAMYYRDRLTRLEEVHLAAITGQGCISTSSVLEFYELTKIEAPCAQEVCGNQKMGLDNQIDAFADSAEQYYQYVALAWSEDHTDAERYAIMLGGSETITWMREMVREIVRNLNTLDDLFLKIICDGNNMVRKLAIGLFVVSLLAFTGVYILFLTRTSRARLIEMESTATLVFGIPEDVAAQVPEIQRFIASGGMFSSQN